MKNKKILKLFISLFMCIASFTIIPAKAAVAMVKPEDFGIDLNQLIDDKILTHETYVDSNTGVTMRYWFYAPKDYKEKKYPVLTYFHGYGEGGDGVDASGYDNPNANKNNINTYAGILYSLLTEDNMKENPTIIIAPQTPTRMDGTEKSKWVDLGPEDNSWYKEHRDMDANPRTKNLKTAYNIIKNVEKNYNADSDRSYVTGFSMGGMATWDLATRNAGEFAAVAPICGVGDINKAAILSKTPIRTYHGTLDNIVPVAATRNMYQSLQEYGNISYTEFPNEVHASWNAVYQKGNVESLIDWMFNQSKKGPINGKVDETPLKQIITQASEVNQNSYSEETYAALKELLTAANETIAKNALTKEKNSYYCKQIKELLSETYSPFNNIAQNSKVSVNKPTLNGSTIDNLIDGVKADGWNNITAFDKNNGLPTILFEWDQPQSIDEINFCVFIAQSIAPTKYKLSYSENGKDNYIEVATQNMSWKGNTNKDFEENSLKLDKTLENIKSLKLEILETNSFADGSFSIVEIEIGSPTKVEKPIFLNYEQPQEIYINDTVDNTQLRSMLPIALSATDSKGIVRDVAVDWDIEDLSTPFIGPKQISGKFWIPVGIENANHLVPVITVVQTCDIAYIEPLKDISIERGTSIENISFDDTITLKLKNGLKVQAHVEWNTSGIDTDIVGKQIVKSKISLPAYVGNSDNVLVEQVLNVMQYDYTTLQQLIDKCSKLNINEYKECAEKTEFINKLQEAKNIIRNQDSPVDIFNELSMAMKTLDNDTMLLDADYTQVKLAIETAEKLDAAKYKNYSIVKNAIQNVVYGKKNNHQATVDEMAKNIFAAINTLELEELEENIDDGRNNQTNDEVVSDSNVIHKNEEINNDKTTDDCVATNDTTNITILLFIFMMSGISIFVLRKKYLTNTKRL